MTWSLRILPSYELFDLSHTQLKIIYLRNWLVNFRLNRLDLISTLESLFHAFSY